MKLNRWLILSIDIDTPSINSHPIPTKQSAMYQYYRIKEAFENRFLLVRYRYDRSLNHLFEVEIEIKPEGFNESKESLDNYYERIMDYIEKELKIKKVRMLQ